MRNTIILASQSPRRKELMKLIPINYEVHVKEVDEVLDEKLTPEENVMALAKQKAIGVAQLCPKMWVVGCDTVVVCNEQILGKPKNKEDAFHMLKLLSGKGHEVLTGVHIRHELGEQAHSFVEKTTVYFKEMTDEEITYYVGTLEPMDKAGAYGIQGYASIFIEKIVGDYYNVMGLPVNQMYVKLQELGLITFNQ